VDPPAGHGHRGIALAIDPARLLVPLLALGTVAAQVAFRWVDDNRLTSWRWVFADAHPARLFTLVAAALVVAYVVARTPFPSRRPGTVLFLSSYAVAACFWGAPEAIVDASRYFTQAKHLELYGLRWFLSEWGREIPAWTDLPLVPALYGLVFGIFGESRVHLQAFTTLLFAGSVVLTHRTGRALWDDDVGFAGAALLLAIPYLLTQVPTMLVDVPTMFFVTLAVFAVVHAVQRGGAGWILLASTAVFLAFLSKYSAWLLLSGLPAIAIVHRKSAPRALRTVSLIALGSGLLVLAALLAHRDACSRQLALLLTYQAPGLRRWGESFLSTFLFQVHPFLTAAAVLSAWMAVRRRDARWIVVAWPVLLLLLFQVRRIRYWVPAFPMLALMAAYGLQAIRTAPVRKLVVTCAVAASLVVALYGQLAFLERTSAINLKEAGAYLDAIEERAVEVFTPRRAGAEVNPAVSVPILDLFTTKQVVYSYEEPPPSSSRRAQQSPLRFTWEYRNPRYYADGGAGASAAVVVISDDVGEPLPADVERRLVGLRLARVFAANERVFEHRTLVRVYRAAAPPSVPDPEE
jgi:4-amino-4-deoxy-L-arabinose transferase-like glycosyltransferase